ncbi:MAG: metallophosphoesterase family protein [Deltaproteobacteria bacterium]|nr:metallophosphoesterase family protein [Deltaproteobacteria bacterium]
MFSDIHGNEQAFNSAYGRILDERADANVFLGDLCGYYYGQREILASLLKIPNLSSIKGNHDCLFIDIYKGNQEIRKDYLNHYGKSMEKLLESDCGDLVAWLSTLPDSIIWQDIGLYCCHGSPWQPLDGYIYPDTPLDHFEDFASSIFILGNTHYPMNRKVGEKIIINPGSLGQPRHGGWPSYAVLDIPSGDVVFREVPYDRIPLYRQIEDATESHTYLKEILGRIK